MKKSMIIFLILLFMSVGCLASDIVIEQCPNTDIRIYHLRTQELSKSAVKEISEIPGTISDSLGSMGVSFNPVEYRLRVVKGRAFSWTEIQPLVLDILNKALLNPPNDITGVWVGEEQIESVDLVRWDVGYIEFRHEYTRQTFAELEKQYPNETNFMFSHNESDITGDFKASIIRKYINKGWEIIQVDTKGVWLKYDNLLDFEIGK